jgi:hypothetical protein
VSKIPTKDSEKGKVYFCKQSEEGEWHLLGEVTEIESIDDDTVGMDMSNCGFSLDGKTVEFVMSARIPNQARFQLLGLNVVNIVYCKDCMHRGCDGTCPLCNFDAVDDYDFCSRGVKK